MGCTDAYREALTRDLSSTAPSAPAPAPGPGQRPAAETDRESDTAKTCYDDIPVVRLESSRLL